MEGANLAQKRPVRLRSAFAPADPEVEVLVVLLEQRLVGVERGAVEPGEAGVGEGAEDQVISFVPRRQLRIPRRFSRFSAVSSISSPPWLTPGA